MTNTDRTVIVSLAFGWIMSYRPATFRSGSAIIGKFTACPVTSSMSPSHFRCDSTGSTLSPMTFAPRLSNSGFSFATAPSSVVQTGVKSLG